MTNFIAFGVGYLLGAKAGRGRYEQMRHLALRATESLDAATRRP